MSGTRPNSPLSAPLGALGACSEWNVSSKARPTLDARCRIRHKRGHQVRDGSTCCRQQELTVLSTKWSGRVLHPPNPAVFSHLPVERPGDHLPLVRLGQPVKVHRVPTHPHRQVRVPTRVVHSLYTKHDVSLIAHTRKKQTRLHQRFSPHHVDVEVLRPVGEIPVE